jgi:hypothetical protein
MLPLNLFKSPYLKPVAQEKQKMSLASSSVLFFLRSSEIIDSSSSSVKAITSSWLSFLFTAKSK